MAAGITLGAWLPPGPGFLAPGDALPVISNADLIALYSVGALRGRRTTLGVLAGLLVWQAGMAPTGDGTHRDQVADLLLTACLYALVAAGGRLRHRWLADRSAAADRLAMAERARLDAAPAERARLARELHDVTAHHLTSIVVNAAAAEFLGDRRPELRAEALDFAARTGRDTLAALHRLVTVLPFGEAVPPPPPPSLAVLADDMRRLGQTVTVDTTGGPPGEAVLAIAREALTNTLRHAPGGTVRLTFSYRPAGAELVIDDDGPAARPEPADDRAGPVHDQGGPVHDQGGLVDGRGELGGGRGLTGMRQRAESLGGTLRAGPRPGGGWRVHALLPNGSAGLATVPRRRRWGSRFALDAGLTGLTLVPPASGVAFAVQEEGLTPRAATLILLAASAHAAPLLWRGRHPWTVLAAVALTTWLGPLLVAANVSAWPFPLAAGADLAAVYAVAARSARPRFTWLAPFAALASTSYALGTVAAIDPPSGIDPVPTDPLLIALMVVVMAMATGAALVWPFGASWLAGHTVRRRRERRAHREESAVTTARWQTDMRTRAERARVASGLSESVLQHTAGVPRAAAAADLPAVLGAARAALAAMRALLDGLDEPRPDGRVGRLPGDAGRRDDRPSELEVPPSRSGW